MVKTLDLCNMSPELTERLNFIAKEKKKEYTEFIDELSKPHKENLYWWVTPLASRNTFLCDCFLDYCIVNLALQEIESGAYECIIVKKKSIKKAIKINSAKSVRIMVSDKNKKYFIDAAYAFVFEIVKYIKFKREIKRINGYSFPKDIILMDTYIESSKCMNGKYEDRYFTNILDYCDGSNIRFLGYLIDDLKVESKKFIKNVCDIEEYKIYIREYFLRVIDYCGIILYWINCLLLCRKDKKYLGKTYTPLVNDAILCGLSCNNAYAGVLNYFLIKRIRQKYKLNILQLIGWYEGQPSSIGLFYGFRKFYEKGKSMAYVITPCQENQLGLYPSIMQYINKVVPECFGISGACWCKEIVQFCDKIELKIVPSFRYQSLFYQLKNDKINFRNTINVLVVLPFSINSSKNLLEMVLNNLGKMYEFEVYLKNHPNNSEYKLSDYKVQYLQERNIYYESGSMYEAVKGKDIVVLAKTTSSLEIMALGVSVIYYVEPSELIETGVPEELIEKKCYIAYDGQTMCESIKKALSDKEKMPDKMLENIFVRVDKDNVSKMFV